MIKAVYTRSIIAGLVDIAELYYCMLNIEKNTRFMLDYITSDS